MEKESVLLLLVTALIFALVGLLAALGILVYLLLKKAKNEGTTLSAPVPLTSSENIPGTFRDNAQGLCQNHPDLMASGMCAICAGMFCETCLKAYETLHFCNEHYELFLNSKWVEVETIKSTPIRPHDGLELHVHKEKMWQLKGVPSYIMTHYKIEIESDQIETHIKLYARESDQFIMKRNATNKRT